MQMLRSEDAGVHYEAVGVLGNLVHSSQEIKQQVLQVRAAARALADCSSAVCLLCCAQLTIPLCMVAVTA